MARDRHQWLRDELIDRGLRAKDVAKRWKVDDAVASRFIKTGEPELTQARFETLRDMLGWTRDQLALRLQERTATTLDAPAAKPPKPGARHTGKPDDVRKALDQISDAVNFARKVMPEGFRVVVDIRYGNGNGAENGNHGG